MIGNSETLKLLTGKSESLLGQRTSKAEKNREIFFEGKLKTRKTGKVKEQGEHINRRVKIVVKIFRF